MKANVFSDERRQRLHCNKRLRRGGEQTSEVGVSDPELRDGARDVFEVAFEFCGGEEEEWCDTSTHTGTYTAEYARSGRAKCKICGEIIALRELRIGIEAEEKGWGIITRWQHVACTRLPRMIATDPENLLEGYDKLTVPDQVSSVSSHHLLPFSSSASSSYPTTVKSH